MNKVYTALSNILYQAPKQPFIATSGYARLPVLKKKGAPCEFATLELSRLAGKNAALMDGILFGWTQL
jgi:hypothetical protein